MSACYPGMFVDLDDNALWEMLMQPLTACEESELLNEAFRRGMLQ